MKFNPPAAALLAGMGLLMLAELLYVSRKQPTPRWAYWAAGALVLLAGGFLYAESLRIIMQ